MPKIELSSTKGLVQKTGHGLVDSDYQDHSAGNVDLSSSSTPAKGAVVHTVSANATGNTFKLTTLAQGSSKGQVKIIILGSEAAGGNTFIIKNHDNSTLTTLTAPGDMAICVFDGTNWITGNSTT